MCTMYLSRKCIIYKQCFIYNLGCEAPSFKMGAACFFVLFFGVFVLIVWRATNKHILCLWVKFSWADDMVQVAKKEMWASEVCFACLTWLYAHITYKCICWLQ